MSSFSFPASILILSGMILNLLAFKVKKLTLILINYPSLISSSKIYLSFSMDWIAILFSSTIFMIAGLVLLYSQNYSSEELHLPRFLSLLLLFIFSSITLIISSNLITLIMGWDSLGISSFCLVIFYQNYSSFKAGMITILSNRIGDVTLLLALGWSLSMNNWNSSIFEWKEFPNESKLFIVISASTKSAQYPFSAWLPAASAAPTPVSSLVHSSTLVTAGIYLMLRFNFISTNPTFKTFLFLSALLTSLMAGWAALHEWDLKKIIASSTLSQLGFSSFSLALGNWELTFFHLITHAYFKALMFLAGGYIIHLNQGNQDLRLLASKKIPLLPGISLLIAISALCGLPFLAGFYSKDLILETLWSSSSNILILSTMIIALSLSVLYSIRMISILSFMNFNLSPIQFCPKMKLMEYSSMFLSILAITSGATLQWSFNFNYTFLLSPFLLKTLSILIFIMAMSFMLSTFSNFQLYKYPTLTYKHHESWFLTPSTEMLYNYLPQKSIFLEKYDTTWMEEITSKLTTKILKYFATMLESNFWKKSSLLIISFLTLIPIFIMLSAA